MEKFAIFVLKWIELGFPIRRNRHKSSISFKRSPKDVSTQPNILIYSSRTSLEKYLATGKGGNSKVVAVFRGLCANNVDGECTIYEDRPGACKGFEVEGKECNDLRRFDIILE